MNRQELEARVTQLEGLVTGLLAYAQRHPHPHGSPQYALIYRTLFALAQSDYQRRVVLDELRRDRDRSKVILERKPFDVAEQLRLKAICDMLHELENQPKEAT